MNDVKKLTPEETIEALRHCVNEQHCMECVMYPHLRGGNCTMKLCTAAADTIEELLAQQSWIPVTEQLPTAWQFAADDEHSGEPLEFIVFIDGAKIPTTLYFNGTHFIDDAGYPYHVTHWQPMLKPPKEG